MTATTERCPGCHGSGIEMSGVTYAGMSEYVGCHECGPECPDDCGCRASDATERPESIAPRHPGATQSPDGSPRAAEGLRGAESAVTDAEAAEWAALADAVTEGSWTASGRTVLGDGYGAEYVSIPDTPADAAFIALARTAVPRLLADRERLTGEVAQLREDLSRLASEWERELTSDHRPASALEAELDPAEFRTKPNPDQPDRCPSIDPHDTLQCTRRIHEDGQCQSGGIAWVKGTPRYMSDAERANRMEGMAERLAERLVDVEERLTGERDRARGTAATLEAENARLREGIERLCSDIDNPLRERHDESPHDLPEVAEDLRALLADTDSAQAEGGE